MRFFASLYVFVFSLPIFAFEIPAKDSARSNPDMGANILLLGQSSSNQTENPNGLSLQELELQLSASIDPYWSGSALLAVEPDPATGEYLIEPEEVFFENLGMPGVSARIGKQKLYFGKLNTVHSHALPFIDLPLTVSEIFGEEGLNETAVSVSYLAKASWYLEVIGQVFNAENERVFASPTTGDIGGVLYVKNLWDLNNSSTFEWLLSGGSGKNKGDETSLLLNSAITYKWRPSEGGRYTSFSATAEYSYADLKSTLDGTGNPVPNLEAINALSFWAVCQFAQVWSVQARTEVAKSYVDDTFLQQADLKKHSLLIGFVPTHFSAIRLQYDMLDNSLNADLEHRVGLQFNFSMGAHPAHAY